jgi:hypothetical protein
LTSFSHGQLAKERNSFYPNVDKKVIKNPHNFSIRSQTHKGEKKDAPIKSKFATQILFVCLFSLLVSSLHKFTYLDKIVHLLPNNQLLPVLLQHINYLRKQKILDGFPCKHILSNGTLAAVGFPHDQLVAGPGLP